MVEIREDYLIFLFGAIFVPLFVFLVKMIIEQGKNAARMDAYDDHIKETKDHHISIELMRQKVTALENDVKFLFRTFKSKEARERYGDHDGSYFPDGDIEPHGAG